MSKQKNGTPKPPQTTPPTPQPPEQIPPALQVFSKTRDIDTPNPYHLDGNLQMYTQQKLQKRQQLSTDPDIQHQIDQIIKLYQLQDGKIGQAEYKRMQRKMALALRPDIEEQELEFVVGEDWRLDSRDGAIGVEEMRGRVFEMVDVWTIGVDKMEYVNFIKLLYKKINKKKVG